jgi:hypothetical protein
MIKTKWATVFLIAVLGCCGSLLGNSFHFTVTADPRDHLSAFNSVCQSISEMPGGYGAFHVTAGDSSPVIAQFREVIDARFGASAIWYPLIGNHEAGSGTSMEWLRNEYDNGQGVRTPLMNYTNKDGPPGTVRTNYSWDYGNAHFIFLNEFWDGTADEGSGKSLSGSDAGAGGKIVPALYRWLSADLESCRKPFVFVFGHEPAFAYYQHVGGSLDKDKSARDLFWELLESGGVTAYICGHTHYYSIHHGDVNGIGKVWQFDAGNAGKDDGDGKTYFDVVVDDNLAKVNVYRDLQTGTFTKTETIELMPRTGIGTFTPAQYAPGEPVRVTITAKPDAEIKRYSVEDTPAPGWTINNMDNNGVWDDVNKKVEWGTFNDHLERDFSYDALPPEGVSCPQCFSGAVIVDGTAMGFQHCISPAAADRLCKFGVFAGNKNVSMKFVNNNGVTVKLTLTGGGWGEISDTNLNQIVLHDTTEKSVFTVGTSSSAIIRIGNIMAEGPMKGINAKTADICGMIEIGPSLNPNAGVMIAVAEARSLSIRSQMPVSTITAAEWMGGEISAPSIESLTINGSTKRGLAGDFNDVNLILSRGPDAKIFALGKLTVKGRIASSRVLSTGNIGAVTVGAMFNSNCFAGVSKGISGLPDPATDINYMVPAAIKNIIIKGIRGETYCFVNSNIAGAQITSVYLVYPQNINDNVPFGLSAGFIKSLRIKDGQGAKSYKNLDAPKDDLEFSDVKIRLY